MTIFSPGTFIVNGEDVFAENSNQSNGRIKPNGNIGTFNFGTNSVISGTFGNFTPIIFGTNYGNVNSVTNDASGTSVIIDKGANWISVKATRGKAKSKGNKNSKKASKVPNSKMALRPRTKK